MHTSKKALAEFAIAADCQKTQGRAREKGEALSHFNRPRRRVRRGRTEARALWAKQREVSPMKQGVPQASLRAQWNDHAELRGAWAHNTPRRKIPFSRAKIASLQFPRPKIRRILAETGRGAHEGRRLWRKQAVVSPMRAKETAQPVAAIAADEPSEAGSAASELANMRRPEGLEWRAHGAKRSAQPRNTAQASAQGGANDAERPC